MAKRIAFTALALALLLGRAQAKTRLMSRQTDAYFQTVSALFLYVEEDETDEFEAVWAQVKALLSEIEAAVSVSDPHSDIARFNALPCGEEMAVGETTARLLAIAREAYEATDGLYDPTIYPLVDLWGFSPRFNSSVYVPQTSYDRALENGALPLPQTRHVDALLALVGFDGIGITQRDGQTFLAKRTPPVYVDGEVFEAQLDLGGIAKGYACDRVMALLREKGFSQGHFVCGGSSLAVMSRPTDDGAYALSLNKPRPGRDKETHFATVRARDIGVSTSVDVSHSFTADGVVYCHVIDPRTGWPINMPDENGAQSGLAGATLLGESAALCDALTTALLVMGPQAAREYAEREGLSVVLTAFSGDESEYAVFSTVGELTLTDPAYRLIGP